MTIRTRFAPSPTGYLHVGGARTALINWLFARQNQGKFILRIEDTDAARNTPEAMQAILNGMTWLGLDWDEGPAKNDIHTSYFQSQRQSIYDAWFEKLRATGRIYPDGDAWRFRFERKPITFDDLICGTITIDYANESNTPDMVIKRSDGSYVFHFVNVVDDLEMEISHVIRGEDHLMNTPKHLQLIEAFGSKAPIYAHIPLILNPDGSKMSKRDAGAALGDYEPQGYLASAVINYLILLGWSPKNDKELFQIEELIQAFNISGINRAPARFDTEKCKWINQQHMMKMSADSFTQLAKNQCKMQHFAIPENFQAMALSIQEKVPFTTDIAPALAFFLQETIRHDEAALEKLKQNASLKVIFSELLIQLNALEIWTAENVKTCLQAISSAHAVKPGSLMLPLRIAFSGKMTGPDLNVIIDLLGKKSCCTRMQQLLDLL